MDNKKRIVQISALALAVMGLLAAAWPVYAADVGDALYTADIVAVNTGTATTDVAAVCDINTDALIDGKFVTSDLLNTAIQTSGGADIAYMPGVDDDPWVVWISSIGQNEQKNYVFYCGGPAMQTGLCYFPDSGGMTTADNDVSLELGNNFTIEQKGYIDTSAGASKNLVYKDGAFRTYVSALNSIISEVTFPGSVSPYSSTSDGYIYAFNGTYATVQAAASGTVSAGATTFNIGQKYGSFPTVAAVNGGNNTSNSTNHTVNLPSGIVSGNLLLVFFVSDGNPTITFPGGWTQLFQTVYNTTVKFGAWYRIADGTEGATITVTTSASEMSAHTSYRITGYNGVPEVGTSATGITANPNPPSLAPSWGSQATLWLAACGHDYGVDTVSAYPTNYTDGRNDRSNNLDGVGVGTARRSLIAASEDPGTFTLSGANAWVANTVAVQGYAYRIDRGYVYFDTSAIPDSATIASATLYLYGQADNSTTDFNLNIQSGMPTYPHDPLVAADFNTTYYSGIGCDPYNTSGFTIAGYNAITLSATGLTWISKTGTTKLCLRSDEDVSASPPSGDEYVTVYAAEQAGTANDPYLVVNYTTATATPAATCSSGLHIVKTTLSGGTLSLQIDSEAPVTVALAGSIPNNGNNWSFLTNGSVPYMEYHKIWIGGTAPADLKQHIVYERDTTFGDLTANNNDATPTFRTTSSDADVSVTFQNFKPIEAAEYTGTGEETPEMLTTVPDEPEEMYGSEEGGSENIPGAELINPLLEEADIPTDFFWIVAIYGLAAVAVVLSYQFIRSSLLFPAIAGFCVILFFALVTKGDPIPLWTIYPYILNSAGFLVMEKTFGW
jgi:hypothetical protein